MQHGSSAFERKLVSSGCLYIGKGPSETHVGHFFTFRFISTVRKVRSRVSSVYRPSRLSIVDQALQKLLLAVKGKVDHVAELISKMRNSERSQRLRGEEMDRRLVRRGIEGATEVLIIGPSNSRS